MNIHSSPIIFLLVLWSFNSLTGGGLQPYSRIPAYWEYNGEPVLLLGGSSEDNLFQLPDLAEELDLIKASGGNYVRNTLSSRDPGNEWAFGRDPDSGKYDLNKWNPVYWERLEEFLMLTHDRGIFVQMELWATFDFYREPWLENPFNPANNINYDTRRTRIDEVIPTHPIFCDNRFFWSIPMHDNNMPVLAFQQKFIDKVLSHSLKYNHVLYCIDNETSVTAAWGKFWSEYIQKRAREAGKSIQVTEMWDPHDLDHISHRETFDHPETYSFVEISQNNHKLGQEHWDSGLRQIGRLSHPTLKRPVNNVKTYGNDAGTHGHGSQNGKESFVRNIFFGSAASRFHRPTSGLGISAEAQYVIRSLRMLTDSIDFFASTEATQLLLERTANEAYCRAVGNRQWIIFLPGAGQVGLRLPAGLYQVRWLDTGKSEWLPATDVVSEGIVVMKTPTENGMWFVRIERK